MRVGHSRSSELDGECLCVINFNSVELHAQGNKFSICGIVDGIDNSGLNNNIPETPTFSNLANKGNKQNVLQNYFGFHLASIKIQYNWVYLLKGLMSLDGLSMHSKVNGNIVFR